MSNKTYVNINFGTVKKELLMNNINKFLMLKKENSLFWFNSESIKYIGTTRRTFTILAGAFNYVTIDLFKEMCVWLWKEKHISSEGILSGENSDGTMTIIQNNVWRSCNNEI